MATARELSREEWKRYRGPTAPRAEPLELTAEEQRERGQLLGRVRAAATLLKSRYAARRVVLFGSLAHAAWFVPDSDVDLAVEGLAGTDYWQAWKAVEEALGDRSVDLIDIETAGESLRRAIERYGVEV